MKNLATLVAVFVLLLANWTMGQTMPVATRPAKADPPTPPAELARQVAPYLDEQTIAVAHVDLARLDVPAIKQFAADMLAARGYTGADVKEQLDAGALAAEAWLKRVRASGGRHMYAVMSLADVSRSGSNPWFFIVAPLEPGADVQALKRLVPSDVAELDMVGQALVTTTGAGQLARLKTLKPEPRPELAQAFAAAPAAAAHLAFIPPPYARRVVEELMPRLPKALGGGPSTALTRGVLWATVALKAPPEAELLLHIQSASPADAKDAHAVLEDAVDLLTSEPDLRDELRQMLPALDLRKLADALMPAAAGDALTRKLNQKQIGELIEAMIPPLEQARARARQMLGMSLAHQIHMGCMVYASEHNGQWPEDLATLVKAGTLDAKVLVSPNVPGKQVGFVYLRPNAEQVKKDAGKTVVLYEDVPEGAPGGAVCYADGHVEVLKAAQLKALRGAK